MNPYEVMLDDMQADFVFDKYRKIRSTQSMEKRKRKPGGGRKPGEFGKLGAVMSLRLPEDLRNQLQRAGKRNRRSMSAELIFRAKESFERERQQREQDLLALLKERGWKVTRDSELKRRKK